MLFRTMAQELNLDRLFPLETSQFGLWLRHKAPLVFGDILEISLIDSSIMRIDSSLLPQITHAALNNPRLDSVRTIVKGILVETEQIKYHLKLMFDRMTEMEVGRDALTQLFNRRFLPTILKKEIEISRKKGGNFSVLMLDIDHFKLVNDTYGHDAGDRVLQQISALIMNNLHAGDFAFRYGGEEFLIVLTEIDATKSVDIAEKIRQRIESSDILLSNGRTMHCTMSIGVAINDGHPDYQRLIERADNALYQAKNSGRNKVVLSSSILK
jgi:diguanylate cyclase